MHADAPDDLPLLPYRPGTHSSSRIELIDLAELSQRRATLPHNPCQPHRIGFHLLIFIERGHGQHLIDFHQHAFSDGSAIFINRHQVHAFDLDSITAGKAILFTDALADAANLVLPLSRFTFMHFSDLHQPVASLPRDIAIRCVNLLNEMSTEQQLDTGTDEVQVLLFSALLLLLDRNRDTGTGPGFSVRDSQRMNRFLHLLEHHIRESRDAGFYAEQLHLSYKTLNQICRRCVDMSAKQLIDACLIIEARRRLILEPQPVQQIAWQLGFDEPGNFVKYFRRHTGITPNDFRQQQLVRH